MTLASFLAPFLHNREPTGFEPLQERTLVAGGLTIVSPISAPDPTTIPSLRGRLGRFPALGRREVLKSAGSVSGVCVPSAAPSKSGPARPPRWAFRIRMKRPRRKAGRECWGAMPPGESAQRLGSGHHVVHGEAKLLHADRAGSRSAEAVDRDAGAIEAAVFVPAEGA